MLQKVVKSLKEMDKVASTIHRAVRSTDGVWVVTYTPIKEK